MRKGFLSAFTGIVVGGILGWTTFARGQGLPAQPVPVVSSAAEAPAPYPVPPAPPPGPPSLITTPPPPPLEPSIHEPDGVWFTMDYLLWWMKDSKVPALVDPGLGSYPGILGPQDPQLLFGGGTVNSEARSGGRFTLGFWFDDGQAIGLEGGYFFLGEHAVPVASGGDSLSPGGMFNVSLASQLQSAEFNVVTNTARVGVFRLDLMGGFRYLQLDEALRVEQEFGYYNSETTWDDTFSTRNRFYGGQVGARAEFNRGRWFVNVNGKIALGVTHQEVLLDGGITQAFTYPSLDSFGNLIQNVQVSQAGGGGLLTQTASFSRDRITVVPEVGVNVGLQLTDFLRATVGYTFLYWSSVARAGDQVANGPNAKDFWAQGLNFGLNFNF